MIKKTNLLVTVIFVWSINILFGAVVFNTTILYPNFFREIPDSLELTMEFLKVRGPQDFFPPLGSTVILLNAIVLFLWWANKRMRALLASSIFLLITFEFIFSVLYFWELNTILFIEGRTKHTIEDLEKVSFDFQLWHWVRFCTTGVAALLSIVTLVEIKDDDKRFKY